MLLIPAGAQAIEPSNVTRYREGLHRIVENARLPNDYKQLANNNASHCEWVYICVTASVYFTNESMLFLSLGVGKNNWKEKSSHEIDDEIISRFFLFYAISNMSGKN